MSSIASSAESSTIRSSSSISGVLLTLRDLDCCLLAAAVKKVYNVLDLEACWLIAVLLPLLGEDAGVVSGDDSVFRPSLRGGAVGFFRVLLGSTATSVPVLLLFLAAVSANRDPFVVLVLSLWTGPSSSSELSTTSRFCRFAGGAVMPQKTAAKDWCQYALELDRSLR